MSKAKTKPKKAKRSIDSLLLALRERESGLKKRIQKERNAYRRLAHKSQRVRLNSPIGPRIGFFTDRLQELQTVICFVEGGISKDEFVIRQNGDDVDAIATISGNISGGK